MAVEFRQDARAAPFTQRGRSAYICAVQPLDGQAWLEDADRAGDVQRGPAILDGSARRYGKAAGRGLPGLKLRRHAHGDLRASKPGLTNAVTGDDQRGILVA